MTNNTYPDLKPSDRVRETCGKCGGTGIYTAPTHVTDSTGRPFCFDCHGVGFHSVLVSSIRARIRREEKATAERQAANEAMRARIATFWTPERQALRDEATAAHIAMRDGDPLRRQLGYALDAIEALDETGADDIRATLAAIAEHEAAKRAVPTGRIVIEGVVVARKLQESNYGTTYKLLIEGEGWKVWGTEPRALYAEKGDRVRLTATVEASADDPAFGFYSRPTKAEKLA
jgi:hypothetical protein